MAVTMHPVSRTESIEHSSIIALLVTTLTEDIKGEWYSDSSAEAMVKAHELLSWPDTYVYLYDTTNSGERAPLPFAKVAREGYYSLSTKVEA